MWVKSIILVVLRTVRTLGAIFIFHAPVNNRLEFPAIKYFYGGEEERKENNHGVTITIRYRARFNDRENRMHEFVFFFVIQVFNIDLISALQDRTHSFILLLHSFTAIHDRRK